MHGVDTADRCLAYCTFISKTVKWHKKVFFCLLQCCLLNNYVTFSKDNPNSCISFLDFMSDITGNLIHTSDAVSWPSSTSGESQGSSRTPAPTPPKRAPKKTPLAGFMENRSIFHPQKVIKLQHENVECVRERDYISVCSVWCSSASRRLLHTVSYAETLLRICSKFQVFISYSFRVIIFFTEILKEGAVDPFNGWHISASGYLNSWQWMC